MIERWLHTEREHWEQFVGEPFVSVDPGADGYAMAWQADRVMPVAYCHALEPELLTELVRRVAARVVVVEAQYVMSLNTSQHILELTLRQYMALGWVAAMRHAEQEDVHLFAVSPSTWQAHQRRRTGEKTQSGRGEGIERALARAGQVLASEPEWSRCTRQKQREGMASALGIGEWWRALIGLDVAP